MFLKSTMIAVVTLVVTFAQFASADTIQIAYQYVDAGGSQSLIGAKSYSGSNGLMAFDTRNAVGINAQAISARTYGFCYELEQHTAFSWNTYQVAPLADQLGDARAKLIAQLWAKHYDSAWGGDTAIYTDHYLSGQPANTTENAGAVAFSYAVYEITYDFTGVLSSLNLSAGSIIVGSGSNPAGAKSLAISWLSGLVLPADYSGRLPTLLSLSNASHQDQIIEIDTGSEVPEPASMGLLALGGLMMIHRRKR